MLEFINTAEPFFNIACILLAGILYVETCIRYKHGIEVEPIECLSILILLIIGVN